MQVVANLYPFRQTVTAEQAPTYETVVENIDIGEEILPLHNCLPETAEDTFYEEQKFAFRQPSEFIRDTKEEGMFVL